VKRSRRRGGRGCEFAESRKVCLINGTEWNAPSMRDNDEGCECCLGASPTLDVLQVRGCSATRQVGGAGPWCCAGLRRTWNCTGRRAGSIRCSVAEYDWRGRGRRDQDFVVPLARVVAVTVGLLDCWLPVVPKRSDILPLAMTKLGQHITRDIA